MNEAVLVFNVGSSSIKFGLYELGTLERLCRGQITDIGRAAALTVEGSLSERFTGAVAAPGASYAELTRWLLRTIENAADGIPIRAAGHRVVHGGAEFEQATRLTPAVIASLERYCPLVPDHQPHNLAAIRHVADVWPDVVQFACFDTAFHRTQPRVAQLFGLPRALSDEGILRYGFHGLSYEYIASVLPRYLGDRARGKVIVAHLGHGASLCAMVDLRSMGTSMGFTALDGLLMGERCGALDPGVVLYLIREKGMNVAEVDRVLSKQSGLLGVSGLSDDVRELLADDSAPAAEAIELFVFRAACEIGGQVASIGGLDALVFTGGIGEHSPAIRRLIVERCAWLGAAVDAAANDAGEGVISSAASSVDVLAIATNEELMIARSAAAFV